MLHSDWLSDSILNGDWLYFHMSRMLYAKLIGRIALFTGENIAHIEFYLQGLLPKSLAIYTINKKPLSSNSSTSVIVTAFNFRRVSQQEPNCLGTDIMTNIVEER